MKALYCRLNHEPAWPLARPVRLLMVKISLRHLSLRLEGKLLSSTRLVARGARSRLDLRQLQSKETRRTLALVEDPGGGIESAKVLNQIDRRYHWCRVSE